MVGAKYLLSKRTGVYATFNQIKNDTKGLSDFTNGGGYTPATTTLTPNGTSAAGLPVGSAGADPSVIALGIMHNF